MLNRSLKKILSVFIATLILIGSLSIPQQATSAASFVFSDVPEDVWYSNAVNSLLSAGVIDPTMDAKFYPNAQIKGSEVAKFLFNAMKIALLQKETRQVVKDQISDWKIFGDVQTDFWAYPYMRSYFNFFNKEMMNQTITREQFALAMVGVKRLDFTNTDGRVFAKDPTLYDTAPLNSYSDKDEVAKIYKYYVELCLEKNVMGGTSVTKNGVTSVLLAPKVNLTRAQVAQFIYNALYVCTENNFDVCTNIVAPSITAIQRHVNVGIMILDKTQNDDSVLNPDPDLFMKLDNNINKPMDWDLVNPKATITDKTKQAYWEVSLNPPLGQNANSYAQELANSYDLLFQTSHSTIKLTQQNSNMIKDFITKGGQMWWEDCDGMVIKEYNSSNVLSTNFLGLGFAKNNTFYYNSKTKRNERYDQVIYDTSNIHPLLNNIFTVSPRSSTRAASQSYSITNSEISSLGDLDEYYVLYQKKTGYITGLTLQSGVPKYTNNAISVSETDSKGKTTTKSYSIKTDIITKNTYPGNTSFYPSAAASSIGKGRLIVTANDMACGICDVGTGLGNGVEDYKFCYNLIGWTGRISVDFREMEGKTWENVNPKNMELMATISNFGGREQEYLVVPNVTHGNWELTTPTVSYTASTEGPITELYSSVDGKYNGYPKKVKLKPNESIKITYTLHSIGALKEDTYSINVNVSAVDNPSRDTDNAPYSMTVNKLQLNSPTLSYKVEEEVVDSKTNYCVGSNIELTIPSPLIIGEDVPTDGYTYKFYFKGYRGVDLSTSTELKSVTSYPGTTYTEKLANKDTYIYAEIKEDAKLINSIDGNTEDIITGLSVEEDTCATKVFDGKTETCKNYGMLVVTIPNVKFTTTAQKLSSRIFINGLSNKNKYFFSGYIYRVDDGKESETVQTSHNVNQVYDSPKISVKKLVRKGDKYNATLKCIIPKYTDEDSQPMLVIKDSKGNIVKNADSTELKVLLSPIGANAEATHPQEVTFIDLPFDKTLYAEITTVSTPLNTTKTVKIPLFVDIN